MLVKGWRLVSVQKEGDFSKPNFSNTASPTAPTAPTARIITTNVVLKSTQVYIVALLETLFSNMLSQRESCISIHLSKTKLWPQFDNLSMNWVWDTNYQVLPCAGCWLRSDTNGLVGHEQTSTGHLDVLDASWTTGQLRGSWSGFGLYGMTDRNFLFF